MTADRARAVRPLATLHAPGNEMSADDTLLRLAIWLADVSVEAAMARPSQDALVMPASAPTRRRAPTKIRSLAAAARR